MISTVMNVRDYLLAGQDPLRIALRFPQTCHSYGALTTHTDHVAAYLLRRGIRKGDRVLLIGDNSFFWVACYLGIMQAGLVCVPIAASSPSAAREPRVSTGSHTKRGDHFGHPALISLNRARLATRVVRPRRTSGRMPSQPSSRHRRKPHVQQRLAEEMRRCRPQGQWPRHRTQQRRVYQTSFASCRPSRVCFLGVFLFMVSPVIRVTASLPCITNLAHPAPVQLSTSALESDVIFEQQE